MANDPTNPAPGDPAPDADAPQPTGAGSADSPPHPASRSVDADASTPAPEAALHSAQSAADQLQRDLDQPLDAHDTADQSDQSPTPFEPPPLSPVPSAPSLGPIDLLADVHLNVKIELGRTRMLVEDVLRLSDGAVVELDKLAGDPVDIYVNDRPIARGEILVLNDNFCVRINEILRHTATREESPPPD